MEQEIIKHTRKIFYDGFKSNGKVGNIENNELRMAILGYYQQDAPMTIESSILNDWRNVHQVL
jgi:hypothetical protein